MAEIADVIARAFSFDNFRWQQDNKIRIDDRERAVGLDRLLYKCPNCHAEGKMRSEGSTVACDACTKAWKLDEYGYMAAKEGETEFAHIPDWYSWERECVKKELSADGYGFCVPVDIYMIVNSKGVYRVGAGELEHSKEGFHLTGCDGKLDYKQNSVSLYTLNSDYYWYGLGDVIGIGNHKALYYCMPKRDAYVVTKARLATEEIFRDLKTKK